MKDEATPEQLAMARRIYSQFIIDNTPGAGPGDVPKFDDSAHGVRIALAAIIKTTKGMDALVEAVERARRHADNIGITDGSYIAQLDAALAKVKREPYEFSGWVEVVEDKCQP